MRQHSEIRSIDLDAPWVPASAQPFRVGDRVRIQINPECQAMFREFDRIHLRYHPRWFPHAPSQNGAAGTIISIHPEIATSEHCPGHVYFVEFDALLMAWGERWFCGLICCQEMELLTPAPEDTR